MVLVPPLAFRSALAGGAANSPLALVETGEEEAEEEAEAVEERLLGAEPSVPWRASSSFHSGGSGTLMMLCTCAAHTQTVSTIAKNVSEARTHNIVSLSAAWVELEASGSGRLVCGAGRGGLLVVQVQAEEEQARRVGVPPHDVLRAVPCDAR